jgi:hypothetical protein
MSNDDTVQKRIKSFFPKTVDAIEWVCDDYGDVFIRKEGLKSEVIELICSKDPEFKQLETIEQFLNALDCPVFEAVNTKSAPRQLPVIAEFFRKVCDAIDELEGFRAYKENNPLPDCNNQEPNYDTVGTDSDTVVSASPEVSKAVDDTLDLQEVTLRLDKETFQRLEAKAKEQGIIAKALIRNILTDEVRDLPRIEEFGIVQSHKGELHMHGFTVDFEGFNARKDIGMIDAVVAYIKAERAKHLLDHPETDTMVALPDNCVSNFETDALTMVKQQNNIITLGELLEQKKHETRT